MIWAIVLLALLALFIREPGCGLIVLVLFALVCAGVWYFAFKVPADQRERQEALDSVAVAQVRLGVRYDRDSCPDKGYPLRVEVRNGSDRSLGSVHWTMEATEPGHSTDLGESSDFSMDVILTPGTRWIACYGLPGPVARRRDAGRLLYTARKGWVGWR